MTATNKILEVYAKAFNFDYYKNMEWEKYGVEASFKSITGYSYGDLIKRWKKIINAPESSINKSLGMWSEFSKNIDYGKLNGLQVGLQTHLGELLNTENIINFKLAEAIDYAYETAKEEAGEPEISKEELGNAVRKEIVNDTLGETAIENNRFKEKFYVFIKFFLVSVVLPFTINFLYDLGKAQLGKVIKIFVEDDAPVIYEIHNGNTYVNIIDQTDKKYRVFFVDDDGNVIDGYTDKENIDMNFEDDEDEQ